MNTPSLNGNWVDLVIVLILIYFASEAWRHGVWVILADFVSFLGALLVALRAYKFSASFLRSNFTLSHPLSNALGFLITAIALEAIFGFLLGHALTKLPKKYWQNKWSRFLALLPAVGEGLVLIAFILTLILGLVIFFWVRSKFGNKVALIILLFFTFEPNFIAGNFLVKNSFNISAHIFTTGK